jgi:F-type H+-transporting ATPase subunit b
MIFMRSTLALTAVLMVLAFIPAKAFAAADAKASPDANMPQHEAAQDAAMPEGAVMAPEGADAAVEQHGDQQAEGHDAAAAEHGESEGGLPQLNVATYPSQIFWLLVMFTVLYTVFSKSILPTIGSVVNAREGMIKANLDEAQALKDKAETIQLAYEKNLELAKANAAKAVMDVELSAKKKAADQVEQFRKKADADIEAAESRVQGAKDKAMNDMTGVAAEIASMAAEKITGIGTDRQNAQDIVQTIASKAKAA